MDHIIEHTNKYLIYYLIGIFSICFGMVLGVFVAKHMGQYYRSGLIEVMSKNASVLNDGSVSIMDYFIGTIKNNLKMILLIFVLGLSVIGTPLVYLVDMYKGFTLGFSFCFIINSFGAKGLIISIFGLVIFNIIYIPIILFSSVLAIENSLIIMKKGLRSGNGWIQDMVVYSSKFLMVSGVIIVLNLVQCIVFPLLLRLM